MADTDSILKKLYYDLNSPVAFTSKNNLYKQAKLQNKKITRKAVQIWWMKQRVPPLYAPVRKKFKRVKTFIKGPGEQLQIDLINLPNLQKHNRGFNHILVCIDAFTRKVWTMPAKTKIPKEISQNLEKILKESKPKRVQSDNGTEFKNSTVQKLLDSHKIEFYTTNNSQIKCSIVERVIKTLKHRIFKYFDFSSTLNWLDILPQITKAYNSTKHSATGFIPNDVTVKTYVKNTKIRRRLYSKKIVEKSYKYSLNDFVRISSLHNVFYKGYLSQWSEEIFKIIDKKRFSGKNLYKVEDLLGEQISGFFYELELQKVEYPKVFRIEKILKNRKIGAKTEYYIKWLGYPSKFNTWISALDLQNAG
jgi:2-hydroxychromene-2-carboxylate isomerase